MPSYRVQFDGMNNIASDYAVPPNKARNIVNCDVDNFGNLIIPRPGSTRIYSGTDCHSWFKYNHDFGLGFFVEGSTLKRLNADYSATTLATVGTAQVSYCRLADTIYYSNGTAFGKYQNGVVSEWGVDVPTMQPTATSTTTGGMFAGDYLVADAAKATGKATVKGAEKAGEATAKGTEAAAKGTVKGAEKAGEATADAAKATGKATVKGAEKTGDATADAAKATGKATVKGAEKAGEATAKGAEATAKGAKKVVTPTPPPPKQ